MGTTYTIDQIRRLVAPIAKQYGVEKVYLFGSYATNSATVTSDIDLRIDKGKIKGLFTLSAFMQEIENILNKNNVRYILDLQNNQDDCKGW